jgi:hypothetical protein
MVSFIIGADASAVQLAAPTFQASPERLEVFDRRRISKHDTWAHIAVAGNQPFIRKLNALVAFEWNEAAPAGK